MKTYLLFSGRPWSRRSATRLVAASLVSLLSPALSLAQVQSQPAAETVPAPAPAAVTSGAGPNESPTQLSPFEVSASKDQGYLSTNTLAGTRLNTNIGDLPGSVTVVTKEQMEDTNSLNINDVFRFEANTEGASTYTPYTSGASTERGNVADALSGAGGNILSGQVVQYASALDSGNRVRGLAAVDNEEDNFFSLYRIPFDAYDTQSIEIDRGPNSIIYGTGSPAGIVNQSRSEAVFNKFSGEATVEGGSWGTFRETADLNIPLIPDTLAIYLAQVYDSQGFEQKPSSDITRRQYAALTYSPFKSHKTKIKFSFEKFNNYSNDPNYVTPQDFVSPWLAAGRPVWNAETDRVTYLNTGQTTSSTYVASNTNPLYVQGEPTGSSALTSPTSSIYVPDMTFFSTGHIISFIDQGQYLYTFKGQQSALNIPNFIPATTAMTPAQLIIYQNYGMANSDVAPITPHYATWQIPTVTSKSVYDWSSININSIDHASTDAKTFNFDLQQSLLDSETFGSLNLDLSWFRQELQQTSDDPLSQSAGTLIAVDENVFLPNGQINSHEGQPYLDTYQSGVVVAPEINNNIRGMLEYGVDLRDKVPSWLSWLGHHRILGVYSQHDDVQTELVYRPSIVGGDANYLPTAASYAAATGVTLNGNGALEAAYYLNGGSGTTPNGQATTSPGFMSRAGFGGPSSIPIQTYNYASNQWQTTSVNLAGLLTAGGGLSENLQDSKTYFWQSWFWNDRIVGSIGIDDDSVKNRQTIFPAVNPNLYEYNSQGLPNTPVWYDEGPWSYIGGNTSTTGVVVHPFKNWASIDSAADRGGIIPAVLRTLSFTFNKSDNFNPPSQAYTDFFGNPLGKPEGMEKDYGIEIATPGNKLFLRATSFTTSLLNQVGVAPTSVARANYMDQIEMHDWATAVVEIRNGENPSSATFGNTSVYPITPAMQNQIAALTGLPYNYGGNVGGNGEFVNDAATENSQAKGVEIEAEYNPTPNWTMKLTWSKQKTVVNSAASQPAAWVAYRMASWQKAAAPDLSTIYTTSSGNPFYVGTFLGGYGFGGNATSGSALGYYNEQDYFNDVVATQLAVDTAANGTQAPNQREYGWSYLTNYTFNEGPIKGVGMGTALQFAGRALAGYYGSTTNLNSTGQIAAPNTAAPIYTPAYLHVNVWVSYQFKLPYSKLRAKVQFNVADLTSNGYLLPVSYNYDGSPAAERIIPPRQYSLETTVKF